MTGINIGAIGTVPTPPPSTAVLYASLAGPNTTSDLYVLDPADGSETSVGPIGFAVTGLAFHPGSGVLYGVTSPNSGSDPRSLVTIDVDTGTGTLVGSLGIASGAIADIGFRSNGVLFGYRSSTRTLYSINTGTGTATQVSATALPFPAFGFGCDFDGDDLLFVLDQRDDGVYHTVDSSTGTYTDQATLSGSPTGGAGVVSAASFTEPAVLWAITVTSSNDTWLLTVDTDTGAITTVGQILDNLDALAWNVRATTGAPHPN